VSGPELVALGNGHAHFGTNQVEGCQSEPRPDRPLTFHRASRFAAGKALHIAPPYLGETCFTDLLDNPHS
jgi:hypothetical protein